jgi:hypothetical protein
MITDPNTNPRSKTLKDAKAPLAFVRPLKVVAKVESEDTRPVVADSNDDLMEDSQGNLIRL